MENQQQGTAINQRVVKHISQITKAVEFTSRILISNEHVDRQLIDKGKISFPMSAILLTTLSTIFL